MGRRTRTGNSQRPCGVGESITPPALVSSVGVAFGERAFCPCAPCNVGHSARLGLGKSRCDPPAPRVSTLARELRSPFYEAVTQPSGGDVNRVVARRFLAGDHGGRGGERGDGPPATPRSQREGPDEQPGNTGRLESTCIEIVESGGS
ncbi:unnamed protein product [Lampetra planeri]